MGFGGWVREAEVAFFGAFGATTAALVALVVAMVVAVCKARVWCRLKCFALAVGR